MVNEIFPKKTSDELSDRDYETDCILTWCCNSLNAIEGVYSRKKGDPLYEVTAEYLHRAQEVIRFLLEESGRLEDFPS